MVSLFSCMLRPPGRLTNMFTQSCLLTYGLFQTEDGEVGDRLQRYSRRLCHFEKSRIAGLNVQGLPGADGATAVR